MLTYSRMYARVYVDMRIYECRSRRFAGEETAGVGGRPLLASVSLSLFTTRCIDSKLAALGVPISSTITQICSVSVLVSSSSLQPQRPSQHA